MGGIVLIFVGRGGPTTSVLEAAFALLLAGGTLLYAGWKVQPLGYDALRWVCWGVTIGGEEWQEEVEATPTLTPGPSPAGGRGELAR